MLSCRPDQHDCLAIPINIVVTAARNNRYIILPGQDYLPYPVERYWLCTRPARLAMLGGLVIYIYELIDIDEGGMLVCCHLSASSLQRSCTGSD
jgi:hypothetical protein